MKTEELYRIYRMHPHVSTDSRKITANSIFFALRGTGFNGNAFAAEAIEKGAAVAVIDDEKYRLPGRTIMVNDTLEMLQRLALFHRKTFDIPFIAITGSNGKTTTKELVHAVLSTTFRTSTTEGNLNNHIGVPLTLLRIRDDAEIAVVEMGANHQGEIASYCRIALPTHGLITNCGKAHLEGFGGMEGVRRGKGELFDFLREHGGTAFIMRDYDYLAGMAKGISQVITYGTYDAGTTGIIEKSDPFLSVRLADDVVHTRLVGDYNLPNVLAAVALGKYFGVDDQKIRNAISSYEPSNSRSQLVKRNSNRIILDAYNANPSSMKAAIGNFASMEGRNKVLVLGAMAELGDESDAEHRRLLEEIAKYRWKDVLLVGEDFRQPDFNFHFFSSADEAGKWLQGKIESGMILVKGSRSMQMEKVLDYL